MSKSINVNPDHYKLAGRERQGEAVVQNLERRQFARQQNQTERWRARHEGPQPWEATAAPSAEDAKPRKRRADKKTPVRRRRRPVTKQTKTAKRSQKRRRA